MAITRLKRKGRKNKLKAKIRAQKIKLEGFSPVIKKVDVDAIKEEFKAAPTPKKEKPAKKEVEAKAEAPKAVKKEEAKTKKKTAPAAKKASPKAKAEKTAEKKKAPAKKKAAPKVASKAKKED